MAGLRKAQKRVARLLAIVAHHDDEALYFGGLLSIASRLGARLHIVVVTAPAPGRKDSATRQESFRQVCERLGAEHTELSQPDDPRRFMMEAVRQGLLRIAEDFRPDIVLTHNADGEPGDVYRKSFQRPAGGHPVHELVHRSATCLIQSGIVKHLWTSGIGMDDADVLVEYDQREKQALLDCYAPRWRPHDYPFAYDPEPYVRISR